MESPTNTRIITDLSQLVGMELDGRYALRAVLGEGAMGVVFRATQLSIQRDVAIKVLKLGTFRDDASLDRFRREMEIISTLTHPNVVRLLDSGVDDALGVFYLAMEFIEGVSLGDMLYDAPRRVKPELALEIVYQVCAGLTEPHRAGIVHRDIKPDNVLLQIASDDTVRLKVVDFGIAKAAADDERVTATGVIVGTPAYMAPELCRATGELDARTDLYALGVMLYELLTGFVPFQADTSLAVMLKQVSEPPPPLSTFLDIEITAQARIQELIHALLDKEPARRPPSAREVRRMIDALRDDAGMGRVRVDSTRSWAQALAGYFVRTTRLPTREEHAIRTTMIMARHTTEQVEPVVTAMAQRTREQRRATHPHAPPTFGLSAPGGASAAMLAPEDLSRPRTELHNAPTAGAPNQPLLLWLVGIAACIAVLGVVAFQLSSERPQAPTPLQVEADGPPEVEPASPQPEPTPPVPTPAAATPPADAGAPPEVAPTEAAPAPEVPPKRTRPRPKKGSPPGEPTDRVRPEKKDPPAEKPPEKVTPEPAEPKPPAVEPKPPKKDKIEDASDWL
jgi:serine/threonine-protein kinase